EKFVMVHDLFSKFKKDPWASAQRGMTPHPRRRLSRASPTVSAFAPAKKSFIVSVAEKQVFLGSPATPSAICRSAAVAALAEICAPRVAAELRLSVLISWFS